MNIHDRSSLLLVPSGYKDGKLYSQVPSSGDGDFTFTRGSNLAATRVGANGLIEKGRENLLLQSNQFDTTWTLNSTSVTSGQSGYDGSSDAWLLNSTTTGFPRIEQLVSASGVSTFSVYAKPATDGFALIRTFGAEATAWFDLINGTITNASGAQYVSSKIQFVGNGWYRCSVTFNGSLTTARIYPASAYGTYSTSGNGVYIQDAQLEAGLAATDYIESGATTAKAGILENQPRLDYSGGASRASLLLEPQRVNLIGYSEYFEGTGWNVQAGITLTPNTTETLSPEGLNNAYKVVSTDATKGFYFGGLNVTNAAVRTIYLKGSVGGETIVFKDPSGYGTPSTKTLSTDWQRFEMATTNDGNNYQGLFIDDISVGTIYAYGAQLELGSYPTSYIPNHSGGSATRTADQPLSLINAGTDGLINNYTTTVYIELDKIISNGLIRFVTLFSTGGAQNPRILLYSDGGNFIVQYRVTGQADQYITKSSYDPNATHKLLVKINGTDLSMFHNGVKVGNITIVQGDDLAYLSLAEQAATDAGYLLGKLLSFPTALPDIDCELLTGTTYESFAAMAEALNYTVYE